MLLRSRILATWTLLRRRERCISMSVSSWLCTIFCSEIRLIVAIYMFSNILLVLQLNKHAQPVVGVLYAHD